MNPSDQIVIAIADRESKRLARRVIRHLQSMTDCLQSGDDSPLANVWDEVCVQVQGQESFFGEAYLDTITGVILGHLETIDKEVKDAIWLQTQNGMEWESKAEDNEKITCSEDDITEYLLHDFVLSAAADWTNARIEKYKDQGIEFD